MMEKNIGIVQILQNSRRFGKRWIFLPFLYTSFKNVFSYLLKLFNVPAQPHTFLRGKWVCHRGGGHPILTRVRGIRFLQFEIILLVYILTIFKVTDLFVKYFLFKTYMPAKKYFRKKAEKLCLIGVIVIESHSFLENWQNH